MSSAGRDSLAPFRNRDFCLFWLGSFLSGIGSQFTTVAMAWQIYELTDSPLQIGLLGLARAVPQTFLLLGAGLLADAVNRRKLMMCTQSGLSCVAAALAILTLAGKASPALLYAATALFAVSEVFWFSVLMLALCGAGDTISSILRATVNQLGTPDELRGRMSSIGGIFSGSGPHLGQFESGAIASWIGTKLSALTGGLATLTVVALVMALFPQVRRFQIQRGK